MTYFLTNYLTLYIIKNYKPKPSLTMKPTILITFLLLILSGFAYTQVTEAEEELKTQITDTVPGWKMGGVAGFNLAQTALYNWAAGGEKSFAVNGIFSLFANYKKGKIAWDNSLDQIGRAHV